MTAENEVKKKKRKVKKEPEVRTRYAKQHPTMNSETCRGSL